jgi:hypothetical protein
VLITTNDISHEGCPLKLGTTSFDGCEDCVVCVGDECEPPTNCGSCVGMWTGAAWFITSDCVPGDFDCGSTTCSNNTAAPGTFVGEIRAFDCLPI